MNCVLGLLPTLLSPLFGKDADTVIAVLAYLLPQGNIGNLGDNDGNLHDFRVDSDNLAPDVQIVIIKVNLNGSSYKPVSSRRSEALAGIHRRTYDVYIQPADTDVFGVYNTNNFLDISHYLGGIGTEKIDLDLCAQIDINSYMFSSVFI